MYRFPAKEPVPPRLRPSAMAAAFALSILLTLQVGCGVSWSSSSPATTATPAAGSAIDQQELMRLTVQAMPGDDDVLATVDGEPVTRGEARRIALGIRSTNPGKSEQRSLKDGFLFAAKQAAATAEAKRRGLKLSEDEVERFVQSQREMWSKTPADQKTPSEESLRKAGITKEQFWNQFKEQYARSMLPTLLARQRAEEAARKQSPVQPTPFDEYMDELLAKAHVEYRDAGAR